MVIQMSPPTEQLASPLVNGPPSIDGGEEPQKLKPDKNGIGVFAKILAGLLKKTGTGEGAAGVKSPDVPLAEITELSEKDMLSADGTVSGGKGKAVRSGKAAVSEKIETKKPSKNSETAKPEFSEQDKNVLLAVGRLTGQGEESVKVEGESALQKLRVERNTVKTVSAAAPEPVEGRGEKPQQTLTANAATVFAANEPAEKTKSIGEKAKNRLTAAETGEKNRFSAEIAAEYQRMDVKKTISGEKEGKSKLEEARNRRRGLTFDVQDFRSEGAREGVSLRAGAEIRVPVEGAGKDITLELRLPNNEPESSNATTTWEAKAGQAFEDILARELHQNFNNDIVRHSSIALRDGNEATIRLALKPESLGNVKIRLEMAENRITGHIVVESEEALRAFEREISSLEKAFRDSGFEGANLQMSLAADGRGADQSWQETEASRFLSGQIAASRYDAALERIEMPLPIDMYQQAQAINVLV